ncbi:histidine phosphatase family protein [Litoribacter ruber]|uniref:SixA phosphatase family protein n=1 Tax=Litoribacter ruber TaxID=702568 RepID=UPI001BDB2057|nr:histidine phosphatase family protein [Litoribacter ruber]MBT0811779.1 histidine phosphatase family protein [Litoribacter ruber]
MTKLIYILRHGEAEHGGSFSEDFKRNLTPNGQMDIQRVGKSLSVQYSKPELLIHSPAVRTTQTAQIIQEHFSASSIIKKESVYESSLSNLIKVVQSVGDDVSKLMLVGHNPGLMELVNYLTDQPLYYLQPGTCVIMELHIEKWSYISGNCGSVLEVVQ